MFKFASETKSMKSEKIVKTLSLKIGFYYQAQDSETFLEKWFPCGNYIKEIPILKDLKSGYVPMTDVNLKKVIIKF